MRGQGASTPAKQDEESERTEVKERKAKLKEQQRKVAQMIAAGKAEIGKAKPAAKGEQAADREVGRTTGCAAAASYA